ncbi:class I SAM-dependent methyltransferase [Radiobacillus kanasensis]|uniref:class I SAM-dependent methyltransferase n=1 Tax=Radiobacillus kanasensis TaxID=2844358 RepID=UPI001E3D687E|nr:class I SAM-dependent methyltransferase [Radiobacillus kanasensis]UFT99485.1 class I SAM-dependent methyltransferase [Radiobacillus kanasensis]
MSDHYYSEQPHSTSDPKTWKYELKGHVFTFTSDHGVFSKNEVDFGSRTLIDAFQVSEEPGEILDLGCGYGPIGLSLAKSHLDRSFILSDINQRAVELARLNAHNNQVHNVEVIQSNRLEAFKEKKFSSILINPPIRAGKPLIFQMYEDSYRALVPKGQLWVVIQKKQGAPSTKDKLEELFGEVELVTKDKGYFIFCAEKTE